MEKVWKILSFINKNLAIMIPVCMGSALLIGVSFNIIFFKSFILPLTFLMVYPMMVNLNFAKIFEMSDFSVQLLAQIINFLIIPFIALWLGKVFFVNNHFALIGFLLASLLPTSGMTISWTGFARGNVEAAVKMTIFGLILGSLATPFYLKWLIRSSVEVNLVNVFSQIFFIVFVPLILGYFTRYFFVKFFGEKSFAKMQPKFAGLATLGVLGIVFVAIALRASQIIHHPRELFFLLIPITILYFLNFLISTVIGRLFLKKENAIALVYGTVMRNLSIALAIAMNSFGESGAEIALVVSAAYIVQVQAAAWYVKYTDVVFK